MLLRELSSPELYSLYLDLDSLRYCERKDAERAIRLGDMCGYSDHEYMYRQLDRMVRAYFHDEDREAFPSWPEEHVAFSDEEPVTFSDGSTVDEADVPF